MLSWKIAVCCFGTATFSRIFVTSCLKELAVVVPAGKKLYEPYHFCLFFFFFFFFCSIFPPLLDNFIHRKKKRGGGGGNYCDIEIAWVYQTDHPFSRTLQYVTKISFHRNKHSRIRQKTISEKIRTNVYSKERLKNESVKMLSNRYSQWRNAYSGSCSFGMLKSLVPKKRSV